MRRALLALGALLVVAPAAQASPVWVVKPYVTVDANGDPVAHDVPFGRGVAVSWNVCDAGQTCSPLPVSGEVLHAGPTAPGSSFEAVRRFDVGTSVWRTPVWQGPRIDAEAPTPAGAMQVGTSVDLVPGRWSGGWAADTVEHLAVCESPSGSGCRILVSGATLEPQHAGHYVIAFRQDGGIERYGPERFTLEPARPQTRSQPLGPVTPPPAVVGPLERPEPVVEPKAQPVVTLRAKALRRKGRVHIGRVTCAERCTVAVRVSGGGRKAYLRTFSVRGTTAITVPARRGKLAVRVRVDGKLLASGKVSAKR